MSIARLERTHDDLSGVYTHTNFYRHSASLEESVAVAANLLLHTERRMKRAPCMVFGADGSAEQSEDAVTCRLRDVAAVALHRLHHQLESRVYDRAGPLGVEVLDQLHRSLDVGE